MHRSTDKHPAMVERTPQSRWARRRVWVAAVTLSAVACGLLGSCVQDPAAHEAPGAVPSATLLSPAEQPGAAPNESQPAGTEIAQCSSAASTGFTVIMTPAGLPTNQPAGPHCDPWYACGDDAYRFPLDPVDDAEQWAALDTAALVDQLQVPPGILTSISTPGLVTTVMTYPFFTNYVAFNTPESGFEALKSQFAALDALLSRPDAATHLAAIYDTRPGWAWQTDESAPLRLGFLELILAQPQLLEHASKPERAQIATAALRWSAHSILGDPGTAPPGDAEWSWGTATRVAMAAVSNDDPGFAARMAANPTAAGYLRTGMLVICDPAEWADALQDLHATVAATYPS